MKKICIFTTIILDFGKKYSERQYVPIDNKFAYRKTHKPIITCVRCQVEI